MATPDSAPDMNRGSSFGPPIGGFRTTGSNMVKTDHILISTKGHGDIVNITRQVREAIEDSNMNAGIATVFVPGSTGALTTIEYEPGLLEDLPELFEKLVPSDRKYHHDDTWGDGNGNSHLRSALFGTSFTVPFHNKQMMLGTWQQIVFLDFDNRERRRELVVQIIGE
jgi:secondary thiamine-phosphate synthase enzyme